MGLVICDGMFHPGLKAKNPRLSSPPSSLDRQDLQQMDGSLRHSSLYAPKGQTQCLWENPFKGEEDE